MSARRSIAASSLALALVLGFQTQAGAQAWVPPAHTLSVTFITQAIDHSGHILNDGSMIPAGKSTTVALDAVFNYAVTDRLSISAGVPYLFAKYRGPGPTPFVFRPVDGCFCFHSGWQDVSAAVQYNVVRTDQGLAITPSLAVVVPSHAYNHIGEAVIGRDLEEFHFAIDAAAPLTAVSPRLVLQGQYAYAMVQRVLDIPNNRSNAIVEVDVRATRRITASGVVLVQRTHGGLRFPDEVAPYPDRIEEHDRLLRDDSIRLGGGVSYSWRRWDLSATYIGYTHGSNTHAIHALTVSVGVIVRRD